MEEEMNETLVLMKKHFPKQTNKWLSSIIKQNEKSYDKWEKFSKDFLKQPSRDQFFNEITKHFGLKK